MNLNEAARQALENAKRRQANGSGLSTDTPDMLKHCAGEVVEAQKAFDDWGDMMIAMEDDEVLCAAERDKFAGELADIIACVLIIARNNDIDIERALERCMEKNRLRAEGKGDKK